MCPRRCVRQDEMSAQVRCHYLTDGTVNFAFTVRRSEYFIPAGILLKCFLEVTDKELFRKLVGSASQVRPYTLHPQLIPQSLMHWHIYSLLHFKLRTYDLCNVTDDLRGDTSKLLTPLRGFKPSGKLKPSKLRRRKRGPAGTRPLWRSARSCCCGRRRARGCTPARSACSTWARTSGRRWTRPPASRITR